MYENKVYENNNLTKSGKEGRYEKNLVTIDILNSNKDKIICNNDENHQVYYKGYDFQLHGREKQTINIINYKQTLDLLDKILSVDKRYFGMVLDERGNDPIVRIYMFDGDKKLCNRDIRLEVIALLAEYKSTGHINENVCEEMVEIILRLNQDILSVSTYEFNKFDYVHFNSQYDFRPENLAIILTNKTYRIEKECEFLFCMFKDLNRFKRIHVERYEDYCNKDYANVLKTMYNRNDVWVVTQCQNIVRKGSKIYAEVEDSNGNKDIISLKIPSLSTYKIDIINDKYSSEKFDYLLEVKNLIEAILSSHKLKANNFYVRLNTDKKNETVTYRKFDINTFEKLDEKITKPYRAHMINIDIYEEVLGE